MASSGIINFQRNWKGSDHRTTVKKNVGIYIKSDDGTYQAAGAINAGTQVTYIDSLTQDHLRAAFRTDDGEVFYANVDYFVKPGTERQSVLLRPSSFGLSNRTFFSVTDYYNEIVNALNRRNDIPGELFDYLYELLDYVDNGYGNYSGIRMDGFPWGEIQNYYGEVIGPIACVKNRDGILSNIVETAGLGGASIYMPPDSERLYDYKLIVGNDEYLVSAKSARGISNQVKPQFVTAAAIQSGKLGLLQSTKEFQLLNLLGSESVVAGALKGWGMLAPDEMSIAAAQSIISIYRGGNHSARIPNPELLKPFIDKYITSKRNNPATVTIGEVRYKCEQLIERWSKNGTQNNVLKQIFEIYLNQTRVIYVKLDLNQTTGRPTFTASAGGGTSLVRNLYLRTSNYATRTEDRIGFQVS
jgi:hypothetical protein